MPAYEQLKSYMYASNDVEWKHGKILVKQGKGKKDRVSVVKRICHGTFTTVESHTKETHGSVVYDTPGETHLYSSYLRAMVKRYAKKAKIC